MIYLDTSVALAQLLSEDRIPRPELWSTTLVSSRLLEYEIWTAIHRQGLGNTHGGAVRDLLGRLAILELAPAVLQRATESFPVPVRTLDALHLASIEFLRSRRQEVELATFDARLETAARAIGIPIAAL